MQKVWHDVDVNTQHMRIAWGGEDTPYQNRKLRTSTGTSGLWNGLRSLREVYNVKRDFTVIIERDEDGIYVASVPELVGCHTQAETLDELRERITEAVQLYLEVESEKVGASEFIGIQRVGVSV